VPLARRLLSSWLLNTNGVKALARSSHCLMSADYASVPFGAGQEEDQAGRRIWGSYRVGSKRFALAQRYGSLHRD
jgi:hypothetical protein